MLETITAAEAYKRFQNGEVRLVDVREPDEYAAEAVPGARLVPLSVIDTQTVADSGAPVLPVVFFCRSGNRTRKASDRLEQAAARSGASALQMKGGLQAWKKAALPVDTRDVPLSLFRQIQIGAGFLVLLGAGGSLVWGPLLWLAVFVGGGLVFAGLTGFCGLGILLGLLPWNRRGRSAI